jgi:cytosine/adenosine deaminase-related metal-dependent hydrolase
MRMPIVIRDATVVTSDAARTVHHDASIVVDADRIVAIGPTEELDRHYPSAERVDGRGKAVFPGLVNCHTHLSLTVARGIQEEFGFPSTLRFPTTVQAMRIHGQAGDVESVMVDGRWLMRDRRVLTIDEGDVVTRAEEIGRRVWRQLLARYPNVLFPIRLPPPVSGVADTSR